MWFPLPYPSFTIQPVSFINLALTGVIKDFSVAKI